MNQMCERGMRYLVRRRLFVSVCAIWEWGDTKGEVRRRGEADKQRCQLVSFSLSDCVESLQISRKNTAQGGAVEFQYILPPRVKVERLLEIKILTGF